MLCHISKSTFNLGKKLLLQTTEHLVLRTPLGLPLIKVTGTVYLTKLIKRFRRFHNALLRIYSEIIINY